ncbi:hypothetical protein Taro_040958 [Colocasia esculenta]|uniref:Uncharacterized protein n=1 Tax=Colocasia esculenta TaxID=4460 RepID=A0A843WEJ6_COLES|nr:hypothetical protein [Colocasia esculenta]
MEDDNSIAFRRMSSRIRRVAQKMVAALASNDNREQAALARLEALENDNGGVEVVEINSDDDASLDGDDQAYIQRRQSKTMKRKTRQAKALESAKKAPRTFLELLHDVGVIFQFSLPHESNLSDLCLCAGKLGSPASTCAILLQSCRGAVEHKCAQALLHCLWLRCKLYLCEMRREVLLMPVSVTGYKKGMPSGHGRYGRHQWIGIPLY